MLQQVETGERQPERYRELSPDKHLDGLLELGRHLRGLRVLHVNATPYGGGVSELLRSVVPLLNGLGLRADWKVLSAEPAFFEVTKQIHNALQGGTTRLTAASRDLYSATSRANAMQLQEEYDVVFLHDPQTAGLLLHRGRGRSRWIWRCHVDSSRPSPDIWAFLLPFIAPFDASVFTMRDFVPASEPLPRVEIIPPAIDPLSPKNFELPLTAGSEILRWFGIAVDRPLVTQVSRFDPWKDPLGVVEAYRAVRTAVPGLQLALVGSMALDDPEGSRVYAEVLKRTRGDPAIHVLTNLTGISNIEVNAFQRQSTVVVQKSIREGFGLVVAEALWKGTPVIAGRAGGLPLQIGDDGGILVDDTADCAAALLRFLREPALAASSAALGRERIRRHYLIPRLVLDELRLMAALVEGRTPGLAEGADPVCGMPGFPAITAMHSGRTYRFCSRVCRERFQWNPERYVRVPLEAQPHP